MTAYYNEIDPYAAQWLRNLIAAGHIAPGDVDDRSIRDVSPDDLRGYTQCHFFAGIGVWSYGLRRAGWDDNRTVWTGSCPCQSFSVAGKQLGKDDERHLWPEWFRLIRECRPDVVFGEQVEGAIRHGWLDDVQADMERETYRVGAVVLPAAGFGAPHIRSRLWFVADARSSRLERRDHGAMGRQRQAAERGSSVGGMADAVPAGWAEGWAEPGRRQVAECGDLGRLADASGARRNGTIAGAEGEAVRPGPTNGFWRDADWLGCRDDKWRPVEPGTFPLAYGAPARVGRLRAYGNAIVAEVAKEFVSAYLGTLEARTDDCNSLNETESLVPRAGI